MHQELEIIVRAKLHGERVAFRSGIQERTYGEILNRSADIASALLDDADDLKEARVAFLAPAGFDYAAVQWAIWRAGGVAVPLCLSATEPELEYALSDSQSTIVAATWELAQKIEPLRAKLKLRVVIIGEVPTDGGGRLPEVFEKRRAMILYTSGTTSKPKGVVTTHANNRAQIEMLVDAWEWTAVDSIPLFLPLHHIHGIINVMSCALWSGATIEPFLRFDMDDVLNRVEARAYSLFMAVPTIYVKLIQALESLSADERASKIAGFAAMRLMVSGSAALPASVHEKWTELTGQKLLERYGMTEIGMALSNAFNGERRPGSVGLPLPGVEIRLKSESGELIVEEDTPGEIQIRGSAVFHEYWNRPEITAEAFDEGWFKTGDMAVRERDYFRIMGRLSVDIIKSGGYKLSALEIEAVLLEHPAIRECAVIGVPDDTWGEAVAAAVVLEEGESLELDALRDWCRERLSVYKIPKLLRVVESLPRNAMGKVTKLAVRDVFD